MQGKELGGKGRALVGRSEASGRSTARPCGGLLWQRLLAWGWKQASTVGGPGRPSEEGGEGLVVEQQLASSRLGR